MYLLQQFLFINGHFTLNLLAGLVCFAVAWLYFDAWTGRHNMAEETKSLGFGLLSLGFVVHSTAIEQSLLQTSILGPETIGWLTMGFKLAGYAVLIFGQVIDPIQPLPKYRKASAVVPVGMWGVGLTPVQAVPFAYPVLAALTGWLYLRRATVGLENHLKPISWSILLLGGYETVGLASLFRKSVDISVVRLVEPFGPLWLVEHGFLLLAMGILGKWIWGYLVKRLETELLIIFTTTTLVVFLVTVVFFTTTAISNSREETLGNLQTNVAVLGFTVDGLKTTLLSDGQVLAQNPEMVRAVVGRDRATLRELATTAVLAKKQTFLVVVSETGEVLVRADDPDKTGGSLSSDPLVRSALLGEEVSSISSTEGAMSPNVSVRSATPIWEGKKVVGAVVAGTTIDNAFLDGLKAATGLEASVYGGNVRSATTFVAPDGKSRWVGIREETAEIKKTVLDEGEKYAGAVDILNVPYYAAYTPLKDVEGKNTGMLFVGVPQVRLLQAAAKSIERTFLVTAGLLVASVVPAYFVSRYIIDQIK